MRVGDLRQLVVSLWYRLSQAEVTRPDLLTGYAQNRYGLNGIVLVNGTPDK